MSNYYEVLGVDQKATDEEIKMSYKRLARKFHPDVSKEENATEQFQRVQEAYATLKDQQKRQQYDLQLAGVHTQNPFGAHGRSPFDDIESWFRGMHRQQPQRQNVVYTMTLADAFTGDKLTLFGGTKDERVVQIPAGVRHGTRILVDDRTILNINLQPHPLYRRSGDDLLVVMQVSAIEAMVGTKIKLQKHLDGSELSITVPAGIQPQQVLRVGGRGMPNPEVARRGDLLIQVDVSIPENLTTEEKECIIKIGHRSEITI